MNSYFRANPIIEDIFNWDRILSYKEGTNLARDFLVENSLSVPEYFDHVPHDKKEKFGYYDRYRQRIFVNLLKCKEPELDFSKNYNYTCWKFDITPVGVICKQTGYHIDQIHDFPSKKKEWTSIKESPVFIKENDPSEDFSDCVRLFICNPDLLKNGRPKRYEYFRDVLNLRKVVDLPWKIILKNCPDDAIQATIKWIKP